MARFDCGRAKRKREQRYQWHDWYAWHAVEVGEGDCRWMEVVQRRRVVENHPDGRCYWEYCAKGTNQ